MQCPGFILNHKSLLQTPSSADDTQVSSGSWKKMNGAFTAHTDSEILY